MGGVHASGPEKRNGGKRMKQLKRLLCFLLAVSLAMSGMSMIGIQGQVVMAAEPTEEPTEASPILEETEDNQGQDVDDTVNMVTEESMEVTPIFEKSDVTITSGIPLDVTEETISTMQLLEEGTVIIRFTPNNLNNVQSLFSISKGTVDANHFHIYINGTTLGVEIRNNDSYGFTVSNVIKANEENVIALKADNENDVYKIFVNGELSQTIATNTENLGPYRFVNNIEDVDSVWLGGTNRATGNEYSFGGTIHNIQVYGQALDDNKIIAIEKILSKTPILEKTNVVISSGNPLDVTEETIETMKLLEEGTIIIRFTPKNLSSIQSLFSISNSTQGNENRHFHIYIYTNGRIGVEIRNTDGDMKYSIYKEGVIKAGEENIIAFKADKTNGTYTLYANGQKLNNVSANVNGSYRFVDSITGVDSVWLGGTNRATGNEYPFDGTIYNIQVYGRALDEEEILNKVILEEEIATVKAGSISASDETVTQSQPFAKGTAGSNLFRIPCLITLKSGSILAAADARYTEYRDFGGIDTIASVTSDGGKTWNYSFPIYLPDSNGSAGFRQAATAIDPVLVQGNDETIYCLADVCPTGVSTVSGDIYPKAGTGYITIDGKKRLALTSSWSNSELNPVENPTKYEYYVGDFEAGFAPVWKVADNGATAYAVDEWYNIYTVKNGEYVANLTQTQVNGNTKIQQNVFYEDSLLHVYQTGYIWLVTSTDNGNSWGNPTILNPQIKYENEGALLVSPGKGIVAEDGTILVGYYDTVNGENAGIFYSDDGVTWNRTEAIAATSSENEIVELPDGTLRMFHRSNEMKICYADITRQDDAYIIGESQVTNIGVSSNCNVSAVMLKEKTIDNKPVILVSLPEGPGSWNRVKGRIYVFTLNADNTMNLEYTYAVNEDEFAYSCMVELPNGNIGILWETGNNERAAIRYDEFELKYVLGEEIIRDVVLDLENEEIYTDTFVGERDMTVVTEPDEDVATVTVERTETVTVPLYDHSSNTANSLASFAGSPNTNLMLENAEFEFIASEDKYQIRNIVSGKYFTNSRGQNMCESSEAVNMTVEKVTDSETGEVSYYIANPEGPRYVMFNQSKMAIDCPGSGDKPDNANWNYNLVLWKRKAEVKDNDLVPGYERVTEIEDSGQYLITAIHDTNGQNDAGERVYLFYPGEGDLGEQQTKLIGSTEETAVINKVQITPQGVGTTTAVVGNVTYNIRVKAPVIKSEVTATAGSQGAETGNNSALAAVDKDENTVWHSDWNNDITSRDNHWITIDLGRIYRVDGLRYLSRSSSSINGIITEYKISYGLDNQAFQEATTGTWAGANGTWYEADFGSPVFARYIMLKSENAKSDNNKLLASAAEIEIRGTAEVLNAIIKEANALKPDDYVEFTEVASALEAAKSLNEQDATDQQQIDTAVTALITAIENLEPKLKFSGAHLVLYNNISVNYKIKGAELEKAGYKDFYVEFKFNGKTTTVSEYTEENGSYIFEFANIAPQGMNDTIEATLYAKRNDEENYTEGEYKTYSVVEYCTNILGEYSKEEYESDAYAAKLRTLIVDLLNYGSAAQIYTRYNDEADHLANTNLTEKQRAWGTNEPPKAETAAKVSQKITSPTVDWKSASLRLDNSVTLRYKIDPQNMEDSELNNLKMKVEKEDGSPLGEVEFKEFKATDDGYYVYFDELNVGQMSMPIYTTIYNGDTAVSHTMCYSVGSYVKSVQDNKDDLEQDLVDIVNKMFAYGCSAYKYVQK